VVTAVAIRGGATFLDDLMAAWPGLTGEPAPVTSRLMKASSRPGPCHPLLFFLFPPGSGEPHYVLKVNRDPAYPDAIEREFRNYSTIYARGGAADPAMPRPVFCGPVGDHLTLCETYVRGRRCEDRYFAVRRGAGHRRAMEHFLTAATTWVRDFHLRTRHEARPLDHARRADLFEQPLRSFARRANVGRAGAEGLLALAARMDVLDGVPWPRGAVHGDFDHGNILIDGRRLGVVDWEECEPVANPLLDLAYLIVHLALITDFERPPRGRLESFFRQGSWTEGLTRTVVGDYAAAHGLPSALFFLALPSLVVDVLTREHPRQRDPRSIPLYSLDVLEFAVALALSETQGSR
jgi:aminoglycoside phosphotransferase (APT) family kinase protein